MLRPSRGHRRDGLITSRSKRKGSPCQQDDDSQGSEIQSISGPSLPEDIWHHIHSFLPMQDAARAACVSHAFLRSWRCHPNLTFSKKTFGLHEDARGDDDIARDFCSKVDHILKKHSGVGVKTLEIYMFTGCNAKHFCYLNSWLQIAVTPGIEKLTLSLPIKGKYEFPYSLLSNRGGDSIRYLYLACCSFCPTAELGRLRSLTRLHLRFVRITGEELGSFLSNSFALQWLELMYCNTIVFLKIPCILRRLRYLAVVDCGRLRVIDNKVPNLSSFRYSGCPKVQLSLGETLQMKKIDLFFGGAGGAVCYARVNLPFSMPNLKTIAICSFREVANTPTLPSKFLHLKYLQITLPVARLPPDYDYLSLISFLDASPSLETFVFNVTQRSIQHISIFADPSDLRQMPGMYHHNLKNVKIIGFVSVRSLVELTCHVVESTKSLECLTLETYQSILKCSDAANKSGKCSSLPKKVVVEARRAILAIRTYIVPKVPSTVKLHVVGPCSCHDAKI